MGRVKDLQIELENLESEFHALIEELLKKNGYTIHEGEPIPQGFFTIRPDLLVSASGSRKRIIVELKLYRSERTSTALLEQSVAHVESYMQAKGITAGILVVTSEVSSKQRQMLASQSEGIEIWDIADLTEKARVDRTTLEWLGEFIKGIQISPTSRQAVHLAELAEITTRPASMGTGEALAKRLRGSSAGRNKSAAQNFERLCEEALKLLFGNDFSGWKPQGRIDGGFQRCDLVARLVPATQFWMTLAHDFHTRYVVFEFKNYSGKVSQAEIYTTEKYLYTTALRSVAIIIARSGSSDSADKAINGSLREQGKLIICVSLNELCRMLEGFDRGDDPCNLLIQRVDDMLMEIAR